MNLFNSINLKKNTKFSFNLIRTNLLTNKNKNSFLLSKREFCSQVQIKNLRNKYLGSSFKMSKMQSKDKVSFNELREMELFMKPYQGVTDIETLKNEVLPETFRNLLILSKQFKTNSPFLIEICINIFNNLKGEDFPFFLVSEFLYHLTLFQNPKRFIQKLPASFVGECETNFYEKAIILDVRELANMSIMLNFFEMSNNFHPYLEKTILHKLEDAETESDCSFFMGRLGKIYRPYSMETFLSAFLDKSAFLINENYITSKDLSFILRYISYQMGKLLGDNLSTQEDNIKKQIELFLIKISETLFEIVNQSSDYKLLHVILRLCSTARFSRLFYKNGTFLGNLIIDSIVIRENNFKFIEWNHIIGISARKVINPQPKTMQQLFIIAINGIQNCQNSKELSRILTFIINKYKGENLKSLLHVIGLKLVEIGLDHERDYDPSHYCYRRLKELYITNLLLESFWEVLKIKMNLNVKTLSPVVDKEEEESSDDETEKDIK